MHGLLFLLYINDTKIRFRKILLTAAKLDILVYELLIKQDLLAQRCFV